MQEKNKILLDEYMIDTNLSFRVQNILKLILEQKEEEQKCLWRHFFINCQKFVIHEGINEKILGCADEPFNTIKALRVCSLANSWMTTCIVNNRNLEGIITSFMELLKRQRNWNSRQVLLAFIMCCDFIPVRL